MSTTIAIPSLAADRLQPLGRLAQLLRLLRGIAGPLTEPESLRRALENLLEIARLVGLDSQWVDRLEQILGDDNVFQIVLAVVRALAGFSGTAGGDNRVRVSGGAGQVIVGVQGFLDWLPIVVEIIPLIRQLRGEIA